MATEGRLPQDTPPKLSWVDYHLAHSNLSGYLRTTSPPPFQNQLWIAYEYDPVAQDKLSWDDFPSVTEREKRLPWYNNRFKERAAEDVALEEAAILEEEVRSVPLH